MRGFSISPTMRCIPLVIVVCGVWCISLVDPELLNAQLCIVTRTRVFLFLFLCMTALSGTAHTLML